MSSQCGGIKTTGSIKSALRHKIFVCEIHQQNYNHVIVKEHVCH